MTRYPETSDLDKLVEAIRLYAQLKIDYGAKGTSLPLVQAERALRSVLQELRGLPIDRTLATREADDLDAIRALRRPGPRRLWPTFKEDTYFGRLEGAFLGRMAGCTLGAPVEFWSIDKMAGLAEENGDDFPPTDYWSYVPEPKLKRYEVSPRQSYSRRGISGVPVDDDTVYTLASLAKLSPWV